MQEENKTNEELIDVGDADESATEVNLDEQQPKGHLLSDEKELQVIQVLNLQTLLRLQKEKR